MADAEWALLRVIIDRVDVASDGSIRIVDYKTGKAPAPQYGQQAKFQMRFYSQLDPVAVEAALGTG